MADELGNVRVSVDADIGPFDQKLAQARKEAERFDKQASRTASGGIKRVKKEMSEAQRESDRLSKSFRGVADSAAFVTGPLGGVASRITLLSGAIRSGHLATLGLSLAVAGLAIALRRSLVEAAKMETAFFKTQAVLKATGSASGLTAEQIRQMSREIGLATLASTEGVERAAQKLLTFRSIQGTVFREALVLSQDLAELGFGPIEAGAVQLGKALEDPINGLQSLRRVGATFSVTQRKIIKDMVETNRVAEAQGFILKVLREQVGGAGAAAAGGLDGAYDTLNQRVSEFLENIGNSGPLEQWTKFTNALATSVHNLNQEFFKTDTRKLSELVARRQELLDSGNSIFDIGAASTRNEAEISFLNKQIMVIQSRRVEQQKAENQADKSAKTAREQAEAEAKLSKEMEAQEEAQKKATKAAEQLAERRAQTMSGLRSEVEILMQLKAGYIDQKGSLEDLETARESLKVISDLQFASNSREAQVVRELVAERDRLTLSIDQETLKRKELDNAQKSFAKSIEATRDRTLATLAEVDAMGMTVNEAEAFKIEQELINDAIKDFGALTGDQIAAIREVASAYGDAAGKLDVIKKKQEEAEEASRRAAESELRLQEKLAEGMTDAIFNAGSAGEAFNALALEIAKAVIQAEILALIQAGLGTNGGSKGGGGSAIIGAIGSIAGLFGGGGGGGGGGGSGFISSVMASRMHTGGIGGVDGQRINAPANMFIGAPRFHNGLRADEFPAILQKGEEVTPRDQVGKGGRTVINNWNISTPDADSFRMSERQISRQARARVNNG